MIGEDVLLFPDSGADFRRALRIAALYSRRLTLLSSIDIEPLLEEVADTLRDAEHNGRPVWKRAADYCTYTIEASEDVRTLVAEGVAKPLFLTGDSALPALRGIVGSLRDRVNSDQWLANLGPIHRELQAAFMASPPNVFDLFVILGKPPGKEIPEYLEFVNRIAWHWLGIYLSLVAVLAETGGGLATTWSAKLMAVLPAVRRALPQRPLEENLTEDRRRAHNRLVLRVFDRYLPSCENLPIHEILGLRTKRKDELETLRVALASLATDIDIHATQQEIELQIADLAARKVDPAVRELEAALKESRIEALKRIGKSSESLVGASVSVAINLMLGAGIDVSAASALIGGSLVPIATEAIERTKIRARSPWSALLRLRALSR